jgi:hypothetical protein
MTVRSPHRDALRILFILKAGGSPVAPADADLALIFKGEARLQAFDFWVRNPDYLAAELLDAYVETKDNSCFEAAQAILDDEEPDLRRVPMIRYFFGAYERLDDALSLLRSRDLLRITGTVRSRRNPASQSRHIPATGEPLEGISKWVANGGNFAALMNPLRSSFLCLREAR